MTEYIDDALQEWELWERQWEDAAMRWTPDLPEENPTRVHHEFPPSPLWHTHFYNVLLRAGAQAGLHDTVVWSREVVEDIPVVPREVLQPYYDEINRYLAGLLNDASPTPTLWEPSPTSILEDQRRINEVHRLERAEALLSGLRGAAPQSWYDVDGHLWEPIPDLVKYVAARACGYIYPPVGLVEDERGRLRFAEGTRLRGVGRVRPLNPVPSCEPARHA